MADPVPLQQPAIVSKPGGELLDGGTAG